MKRKLLAVIFFGITTNWAQSPLNSLHFDGSNDYVTSSLPTVFSDIPNNDFTIETWVKPTGSNFCRLVFAQFNTSNFATVTLSASNQVYFYVNNVTGEVTTASLPLGVWSHVACTWDASTGLTQTYINGVLQATTAGGSSSVGNDNVMAIGARTNAAQFFTGEMDEVRIWDVVRTECQITGGMNSEYTVPQTNMVAYYNFNQGVAGGVNTGVTSLPDFTGNYDGVLLNFGLSGTTSNWLSSGASITSVNQTSGYNTVDIQTACGDYTWIDGFTYSSSTNSPTYTFSGGAVNGCDSTVTLNLTILNLAAGTDVQVACGSYTWVDGLTYNSSTNAPTYTYIGGASNGCDSIVTLDLTINAVNVAVTQNGTSLAADEAGATYQWVTCPGMLPILGATNQSYVADSNGDYAVIITNSSCTDTSACYSVSNVGLVKNRFENELLVYPNPTDGNFFIELGASYDQVVLTITDLSGRIIRSKTYSQVDKLNLNLEEPSGVYLLTIESTESRAVIRLIRN